MENDEEIDVNLYEEVVVDYYRPNTPRISPYSSLEDVRAPSPSQGSMKFVCHAGTSLASTTRSS